MHSDRGSRYGSDDWKRFCLANHLEPSFLGLLLPATGVLSLEDHGAVAGSASALQGAIQVVNAAVSMTLVGVFADHTPAPMLFGIALCALAAMLVTLWTLRRIPAHLARAQCWHYLDSVALLTGIRSGPRPGFTDKRPHSTHSR